MVGGVLAALPVKNPLFTINRGYMHKTLMATFAALISTPSLAILVIFSRSTMVLIVSSSPS